MLRDALQNHTLDIILISSGEALENLLSLTGKAETATLLDIQLAVTHPRQAEKAKALGFTRTPIISQQPGDTYLVDALLEWRNQ